MPDLAAIVLDDWPSFCQDQPIGTATLNGNTYLVFLSADEKQYILIGNERVYGDWFALPQPSYC